MFAVISDVHANLEALQSVLNDIRMRGILDIFFLGDAVGYGPNPEEVVEILHKVCRVMVAGNHDQAVVKPELDYYFNDLAREAIKWTRTVMGDDAKQILKVLPMSYVLRNDDIDMLFVHASPRYPEEWNYILTLRDAELNFHYFNERICFIGHSHVPFVIERSRGEELTIRRELPYRLREDCRYIINAGSVGQPRDGDQRACYVIFDESKIDIIRVPYDIHLTQRKMKDAGLPLPLIDRLSKGV
jgi:predicted phosphodiesterase